MIGLGWARTTSTRPDPRLASAAVVSEPPGEPAGARGTSRDRPRTTPGQRHVPGELVHQVTLGRDRELVHQLVGHPDRRTGGRGQGQRVPDADRQLPGSAVPAAVNPIRAVACAMSCPCRGPVVSAASSSSMSTPVTVTSAARSRPAVITSAGSG